MSWKENTYLLLHLIFRLFEKEFYAKTEKLKYQPVNLKMTSLLTEHCMFKKDAMVHCQEEGHCIVYLGSFCIYG